MKIRYYLYQKKIVALIVFVIIGFATISAQDTRFVLVIDAGHGNDDPGAMGKYAKEKNINLAVALKLGELVQQNHKDVKIVYTRKTDVFIPLQKRADIANDNHADFFISIHTNSAKASSAYGTETYTLGLTKSKSNLDVAMRENSVMLLESDYKTKYKGFDPSSVDSYIMFEFMQDKYIDRSIEFASLVQNKFTNNAKRYNRGVRQAGFWVLHATAAPSVLIELGFISNREEENFLASGTGQNKMAEAISDAFTTYKHNHDKRSGKLTNTKTTSTDRSAETKKSTVESANVTVVNDTLSESALNVVVIDTVNSPVFKVQFMSNRTKLDTKNKIFRELDNVEYYFENDVYKYTAGRSADYNTIVDLKESMKEKYKDAFVVAFLGEKKITITEALSIINANK